jgi:ubiquitin-protein ligase
MEKDYTVNFKFVDYPNKCPEIRFVTKINHPKVNKITGKINDESDF